MGYTLRLPYPPEAQFMRLHADAIVAKAAEIDNKTLDFSVASLRWIDATLFAFHEDAVQANDVAETLFRFGAYVGEVLIQNKSRRTVGKRSRKRAIRRRVASGLTGPP